MITTTRFRLLRLKYHVTLTDVAEQAGVKNQNLSDWERGQVCASLERQTRIFKAFLRLAEARIRMYQELIEELKQCSGELLTPMEAESDEP